MRIKRLDLLRYMTDPENYPFDLKEITAIFGKDGWYLSGNQCWFEYSGKAFTGKHLTGQFKTELQDLMTPKLSEKHIKAIKLLQEIPEFRPLMAEMQWAAILWRIDKCATKMALERRKRKKAILNR